MAPRQRSKKNQGKPKGVYRKMNRNGTGRWIYREYLGMVDGKAKFAPDVYLCPLDAPMSKLWEAYEQVTQESRGTLEWLLNQYHASKRFQDLTPRTRKEYQSYKRLIGGYIAKNGRRLGTAPLEAIGRTTIRGYRDNYGAPTAANRHIQYLKAAWNWGLEWYEWMPDNPCLGVKLNTEGRRDRYVSQAEFEAFKEKAAASGYIPLFMELAYLCRARWSEIAGMTRDDILEEGLRVRRLKGSEGEITAWSPRLRAVVDACRSYNAQAPSPISGAYLIHTKRGGPIKQNTFQASWGRLMRAWVAAGGERFTFHDLKAAGYSDMQEQFAGHRDQAGKMHKTYNRKLRIIEPPA